MFRESRAFSGSWRSRQPTPKFPATRLLEGYPKDTYLGCGLVVYNASNNELVRTQTLVKGAIVQVDAAPFKQWFLQHYDKDLGRKKKVVAGATKKEGEEAEAAPEEAKKSNHVVRKIEKRQEECKLDRHVEEQFSGGCLYAAISSRPGQCGRADGYVSRQLPVIYVSVYAVVNTFWRVKELEFCMKKLQKKGKGAA
ncbi:40S ribosomal protein S8-like protein [Tanacetum coccineum]